MIVSAWFLLSCAVVDSARILGYFPVPSISHQVVYRSLLRELSVRGHDVTIVTPDPFKQPGYDNYKEIDVHDISYKLIREWFDFSNDNRAMLPEYMTYILAAFGTPLLEQQFATLEVQDLIKGDHSFDLVFYEQLFYPAAVAFAYKFKAPAIGISSLAGMYNNHLAVGNPVFPSYHPDVFLPHTDQQTFLQRLRTSIYLLFFYFWYNWYLIPVSDDIVRRHFGPDIPSVRELESNVSLVMVNTDFVTGYPRPNLPNYIEIGGGQPIHFTEPKSLPEDLQTFLDSAVDGVVYFSLGSNVKSSTLPPATRQIFVETFKRIKQKVLWKWETEDLPGKPDNVKISKWLPQTDVLAHPNIRVFVTQGGLQSIGEATYHGVPLIIVPFFADQEQNSKKMDRVGGAVLLDLDTMNVQKFVQAIEEVVYNTSYKVNMQKYSDLTKDQPQTPMERAVWWTEYVLRHNGARHMRSPAVEMPIYQYLLFDVVVALIVVVVTTVTTFNLVVRTVFRMCCSRTKYKNQ